MAQDRWDMLADDMSNMLDWLGYSGGRWSSEDIRPHLEEFIAKVKATADVPAPAPQAEPARHTCNSGRGPAFGRKTPGCPRCDELLAGAEPRTLAWVERADRRRAADAERAASIRAHFTPDGPHSRRACGPVCTFGDW